MARDEQHFFDLVFTKGGQRRFTQNSPILPDVFVKYALSQDKMLDLLVTPDWSKTPGQLAGELQRRLGEQPGSGGDKQTAAGRVDPKIAFNQSVVAAKLSFEDLVRCLLPLSAWWQKNLIALEGVDPVAAYRNERLRRVMREELLAGLKHDLGSNALHDMETRHWMIRGEMVWAARLFWIVRVTNSAQDAGAEDEKSEATRKKIVDYFLDTLLAGVGQPASECFVHSVNRNREITSTIVNSLVTTKADAASRTFDVTGQGICWAIIDAGIDARHQAFRKRREDGRPYERAFVDGPGGNHTRIRATYDFADIRSELSAQQRSALKGESGRLIDWRILEETLKLRVQHNDLEYVTPKDGHGTHVAGILGADWTPDTQAVDPIGPPPPPRRGPEQPLRGMCPAIELYDLRVFRPDGSGDEFAVMSALQFVRSLNQRHDSLEVHGVNLSLAMEHDVANYACGRSPVCEECTRLVSNGIVVVAAAGNQGRSIHVTVQGQRQEGYRTVSIADPGNAQAVITVGSTHRSEPHTYGVSYFSSRGPTGDGRSKPDLVAPGEKILSTLPGNRLGRRDGTSQAAPHVSGAAALLMSRHRELIGEPARIKEILMQSATDLGREKHYQGAGLVDVMRAVQSL
jgi:subtilisin family serine protease